MEGIRAVKDRMETVKAMDVTTQKSKVLKLTDKPLKPTPPHIDDIHDESLWSLWMPSFVPTTVSGIQKRRLVTPDATFTGGMNVSEALAGVATFGIATLGESVTTVKPERVKKVTTFPCNGK
jgi:hypothetical protein